MKKTFYIVISVFFLCLACTTPGGQNGNDFGGGFFGNDDNELVDNAKDKVKKNKNQQNNDIESVEDVSDTPLDTVVVDTFFSADLALFDLRGPVRNVLNQEIEGGKHYTPVLNTLSFDRKGRVSPDHKSMILKRDLNNNIVSIEIKDEITPLSQSKHANEMAVSEAENSNKDEEVVDEEVEATEDADVTFDDKVVETPEETGKGLDFKFDRKHNRLNQVTEWDASVGSSVTRVYVYSIVGELMSIVQDGVSWRVTVDQRDKHGNWIKRTCRHAFSSYTEKRKIVYFDK